MNYDLLTYAIPIVATIISVFIALVDIIFSRKDARAEIKKAEAFIAASHNFNDLNKIILNKEVINNEEIYKNINNINSEINSIFDELTKSNCRTIIRVIVYDDNVPMVASIISQSIKEKTKHETKFLKMKMFEDTSIVFYPKHKDYFLNNDLAELHSSLPAMPKSNQDSPFWNFAFSSSLVVPIRKLKENETDFLYGMLCIDSDKKNAFKNIHIDVAKKIVIQLTPLFAEWTKKMIDNNNKLSSTI